LCVAASWQLSEDKLRIEHHGRKVIRSGSRGQEKLSALPLEWFGSIMLKWKSGML
jgi:hypothetical protein